MNKKLKNDLVVGNRSLSEQILIDLLRFHFKKITILPGDRLAIGKELDIFIPEFKVAIEVQGPTHQRVIFTEQTFLRTVENDKKKVILCEQAGIKLIAVDLPDKSTEYYKFLKQEVKNRIVPEITSWINR